MVTSSQLSPGMVISLKDKLYKVITVDKVSQEKGDPFIHVKIKEFDSDLQLEKTFKLNQDVKEVSLSTKVLEYLYQEGENFLFLDIGTYEKILVPPNIVSNKILFLKPGIQLTATGYKDSIFSLDLPNFLELMIAKTDFSGSEVSLTGGTKKAILETGAEIQVPPFIEIGDIIKIDTRTSEYIQRV